jgi:hypothetical protein
MSIVMTVIHVVVFVRGGGGSVIVPRSAYFYVVFNRDDVDPGWDKT